MLIKNENPNIYAAPAVKGLSHQYTLKSSVCGCLTDVLRMSYGCHAELTTHDMEIAILCFHKINIYRWPMACRMYTDMNNIHTGKCIVSLEFRSCFVWCRPTTDTLNVAYTIRVLFLIKWRQNSLYSTRK